MIRDILIPDRSGRIAIIGDVHFDSYYHQTRMRDAPTLPVISRIEDQIGLRDVDALIIAGDLAGKAATYWPSAIDELDRYVSRDRIYILPGNHDYYGAALGDDDALRSVAEQAGVHLLQKQVLRHGATRILAATLWTDFRLSGDPAGAMNSARASMRDYRAIRKPTPPQPSNVQAESAPISPEDTVALHEEQKDWLITELGKPHFAEEAGQTVIVTHHGPHPSSAGPIDELTPAFHSDLSTLIERYQPNIWFFGHSHRRISAWVGQTELRNVSIGCPGEIDNDRLPSLAELCILQSERVEATGEE